MPAARHRRPDHYLQLPSLWPQVLEGACKTNVGQGAMDDASQNNPDDDKTKPKADKAPEAVVDPPQVVVDPPPIVVDGAPPTDPDDKTKDDKDDKTARKLLRAA